MGCAGSTPMGAPESGNPPRSRNPPTSPTCSSIPADASRARRLRVCCGGGGGGIGFLVSRIARVIGSFWGVSCLRLWGVFWAPAMVTAARDWVNWVGLCEEEKKKRKVSFIEGEKLVLDSWNHGVLVEIWVVDVNRVRGYPVEMFLSVGSCKVFDLIGLETGAILQWNWVLLVLATLW